jgi:hypothetical protein
VLVQAWLERIPERERSWPGAEHSLSDYYDDSDSVRNLSPERGIIDVQSRGPWVTCPRSVVSSIMDHPG